MLKKLLSHMTKWVLVPIIVLAVSLGGMLITSSDSINVQMRSEVASIWSVFMAVTAWTLMRRWVNWLNGVRFKQDVAPKIYENGLSAAIHSVGNSVALAILISTVMATVRI